MTAIGRSRRGIEIVIDADVTTLEKGLNATMSGLRGLQSTIGRFATAAAVVAATRAVLNFADNINELAVRSRVAAEWLQAGALAMSKYGVNVEQLTESVTGLGKSIGEALGGDDRSQEAFKTLGVTLQDLKEQSPEQIFEKMADALGKSGRNAERLQAALKILGPSGRSVIPGMAGNFKGSISAARNGVASTDALTKVELAGSALDAGGQRLKAAGVEVAASPLGKFVARSLNAWNFPRLALSALAKSPLNPIAAFRKGVGAVAASDLQVQGAFSDFEARAAELAAIREELSQVPDPTREKRSPQARVVRRSLSAAERMGRYVGSAPVLHSGSLSRPDHGIAAKLDAIRKELERNTQVTADTLN